MLASVLVHLSAVEERAPHVEDARLQVDVAPLERGPLARPKSGRGSEDHHRSSGVNKLGGCLGKLRPRFERSFLGAPSLGVIDAVLRWIDVDHPPCDRPCEYLAECLCCLEAVPRRDRHSPGSDLLRAQLAELELAKRARRLREQPTKLLDRLWLGVVLG
jgi:hypothetical protein